MRLFKYLHPDRVDVLTGKRIAFSPPKNLNDPFEMKPPMSYAGFMGMSSLEDADIDAIFQRSLEEYFTAEQIHMMDPSTARAFRSQIKESTAAYIEARLDQMSDGLYEATNRHIGMLCLSERQDDILMWAHYTNSHEGYVIEFDPDHAFFNCKVSDIDELRHLRRVHYSDQRPDLSVESATKMRAFLTKSSHWSYEAEWRILGALKDASEVVSLRDRNIHLFSFPSEAVKSVTIGCRASVATAEAILNALAADGHFSTIPVFQAVPDKTAFKLNIVEISRPDDFVPQFAS
jgi:hypothetical protein